MNEQPIYSSTQLLNQIAPAQNGTAITEEVLNRWSSETEKKVEHFDLDKRQQTAASIKELDKLVITA